MRAASLIVPVTVAASACVQITSPLDASDDPPDEPHAIDATTDDAQDAPAPPAEAEACVDAGGHDADDEADPCCPANWFYYACTFPDGGAGHACHNPRMGCPSSSTCGLGCDFVVAGRCGDGG